MTIDAAGRAHSEAATNQLALFRSRRFTPLFAVQFLGAFNDQTFKNAFVALLTCRLADGLALAEGWISSCSFPPRTASSPSRSRPPPLAGSPTG